MNLRSPVLSSACHIALKLNNSSSVSYAIEFFVYHHGVQQELVSNNYCNSSMCFNSFWLIEGIYITDYKATMAQVMACCLHISSGNGLLPDSTKPLPEPVLAFYLLGPMAFIQWQFYKRYLSHQS